MKKTLINQAVKICFKPLCLLIGFISLGLLVFAKPLVAKPVCEYHINPIGIDVVNPRLSWQMISTETNAMQTAYEIRCANTSAALSKGNRLLWTSGKVVNDHAVNIPYQGPALKSMQRVYWQVRIWDNKNNVSAWSEPAFWEIGLFDPSLWTASFITVKGEEKVNQSLPAQYYRKTFSTGKKIQSARLYASSLGLYQMFLNGKKISGQLFTPGFTSYKNRLQYQTYDITSMLQQKNAIGAIVGDGWYRGYLGWDGLRSYYGDKLALIAQIKINYVDGSSETIGTDNTWKTSYGPILKSDIYNGEKYDARLEMDGWANGTFNDNGWVNAGILNHSKEILVASNGLPVTPTQEITPLKKNHYPLRRNGVRPGSKYCGLGTHES